MRTDRRKWLAIAFTVVALFLLMLTWQGYTGEINLDPREENLVIFWNLTQRTGYLIVMKTEADKPWTTWEVFAFCSKERKWKKQEGDQFVEKVPEKILRKLEEISEWWDGRAELWIERVFAGRSGHFNLQPHLKTQRR